MYEDIKTVCLYARYSSANQTEQSIEGQVRVCKAFCESHGMKIVKIYADRATSASKDISKRVQFLQMIKDSEGDDFQAVVVYKLDRFSRSRYDSANYKYRLKKNGVQLISATENISNDPEGIILESVLEGMAEFYSAELGQKITRGLWESAYKCNSVGGVIPLGYKVENKKLVIDEETAPIVREAFQLYAEGHSIADICRTFNAKGYKTSKSAKFGKSSFYTILHNEKYIGVYKFHDYKVEGGVPAIIDRDLFDEVQSRMRKIKKSPGRNKAKTLYLLSGKLFCGHCGSIMYGDSNGENYGYYICAGRKTGKMECKKRSMRKPFIENIVVQDALSLLTDDYIRELARIAVKANTSEIDQATNLPVMRGKLHETKVSIDNLTKAIETGSAPASVVKRIAELEKEQKVIEQEIKSIEQENVSLDEGQVIHWLTQFKEGSIEDQDFCRTLVDLLVNSVTVWDEPDDYFKIVIAYNLTSVPSKTFRISKKGEASDLTSNASDFRTFYGCWAGFEPMTSGL